MDATSRYPEVYARWQRDPQGFWGEAAAGDRLDRDAGDGARSRTPASTAAGSPAASQHLLQRARPPCRSRARRAAGAHLRQPGHRHEADLHLPRAARPRSRARRRAGAASASARATASSSTCRWCRRRLIAMLACARLGAVHSVVFGGFAANELATRIDDAKPKLIVSASCGIEPGRVIPYKPLLDAAIELAQAQAGRLPHPAAAAGARRADRPAAIIDWAEAMAAAHAARLRAGRRDRSALHPLHLRHDRPAQGRRARQWRPRGGARLVDDEYLRRRAGRGVLGGLRRRLGGRPFLHRLWRRCSTARPRSSTRASRSARPTPAPSGASSPSTRCVALFTAPTAFRAIKRDDPEGKLIRSYDLSKFRTLFLAGERADPDTLDWAEKHAGGAGHRSLVADRDRLADRRPTAWASSRCR